MKRKLKIIGGRVITPLRLLSGHQVVMEEGKIVDVSPYDASDDALCAVFDAAGRYVSPGFVDIHVHGGGGHDFMDATQGAFNGAARLHRRHGTTSLLPTTLCCPHEELLDFLSALSRAQKLPGVGAALVGAHLEGPHFSMGQRGAQDPRFIVLPDEKKDRRNPLALWGPHPAMVVRARAARRDGARGCPARARRLALHRPQRLPGGCGGARAGERLYALNPPV